MYDPVRHRVLLGTGKGGTPDQHSNTGEHPRERWRTIKSARGVTQCIENSGKGKTTETEDPLVSRKIKKDPDGQKELSGNMHPLSCAGMCCLCASPVLSNLILLY